MEASWNGARSRAADERRLRRARAFVCTRPLHRMEADKGGVHADLEPYPLDQLALDAIELVALGQQFQDGLTRDELVEQMSSQAARHAPARPAAEWELVAQRVVGELLAAHPLRVPDLSPEGDIRQVLMTLRLLTEHESAAGRIYLRSGAEAINVLVDRLDTDAASEAQAAELRLRFLVANRQLRAAQSVAGAMRILSVQHMEDIRRFVEAARRNLIEIDWAQDVLPHLRDAHAHLQERLAGEGAVIVELEEVLVAPETRDRQSALETLGLLRDVQRTHAELLTHLASVHETFADAQDRQLFVLRPLTVRRADLRADVLGGFMAMTLADAEALRPHPAELLGAVVAPLITPAAIVQRTIESSSGGEGDVPADDEPELEHDEELNWRRAALEPFLEGADGKSLSELLDEAAAELEDDQLWALATMALEAYGGEHLAALGGAGDDAERTSVPDRFRAAVALNEELRVEGARWLGGDDLLLLDVELTDAAEAVTGRGPA